MESHLPIYHKQIRIRKNRQLYLSKKAFARSDEKTENGVGNTDLELKSIQEKNCFVVAEKRIEKYFARQTNVSKGFGPHIENIGKHGCYIGQIQQTSKTRKSDS